MKRYRIYADTSVFGGCFDEEFSAESKRLFDETKKGKFTLVVAPALLREIYAAPLHVQKVLTSLPAEAVEILEDNIAIVRLRNAYIKAGVLGKSSEADAEHIASASVADVDFLVSWNFKHIVHFEKIQGFQSVNLIHGYKPIRIYSPKEVVEG